MDLIPVLYPNCLGVMTGDHPRAITSFVAIPTEDR